jgi:hypothetical protein
VALFTLADRHTRALFEITGGAPTPLTTGSPAARDCAYPGTKYTGSPPHIPLAGAGSDLPAGVTRNDHALESRSSKPLPVARRPHVRIRHP